jgi:polyphosphate kinase
MATVNHEAATTFGPECFINRELGWLDFNQRVLEEAENPDNPLMERLKFLAIFSSNLDEFFMIRVSGLREQAFGESAPQDYSPDGMSALVQLKALACRTQELVARQYACVRESIGPAMAAEGFRLLRYESLEGDQREQVDRFFRERALPILTPMAVDPAHPSPRYHNRGLYLGVMLHRGEGLGPKRMFAVVQVPQVLPRIVALSGGEPGTFPFVLLEDIVSARLPELFGGFAVESWTAFRITRDSDVDLLEQESDDMLKLIEDRIKARQRGQAVRIEIASKADDTLAEMIIDEEGLQGNAHGQCDDYSEVYRIDGPLDLTALWELYKLPGFDRLHDKPFTPRLPRGLERRSPDIFASIAQRDILLHHPYESFDPVVEFVTAAAADRSKATVPTELLVVPAGYGLNLSLGWKGFALDTGYSHAEPLLASPLAGRMTDAVNLGLSYGGRNWRTRLEGTAEQSQPLAFAPLTRRYSLELGGAYRVAPRLSVTGGLRYRIAPEPPSLVLPNRDDQAVYLGTSIAF